MSRSILFIDNGGYSLKALYLPADQTTTTAAAATAAPPHLTSSTSAASFTSSRARASAIPSVLVLPNCIGAAPHAGTGILGDQITRLPHFNGLMVRRPVDRGYVVDGGLQARIWEHVLQHFAIAEESSVDIWLTVPFGAPKAIAQLLWLLCTRSFRFHSITLVSSSFLSLIAYSFGHFHPGSGVTDSTQRESVGVMSTPPVAATSAASSKQSTKLTFPTTNTEEEKDVPGRKRTRTSNESAVHGTAHGASSDLRHAGGTAILVDVGFSGTTITPYIDFIPVTSSSVRIDVGGKLLTNRLKEFLSFSQVNVMEDTWLMNYVRERCCVVALDPAKALQRYTALWRGRSRAEVEAVLQQESTRPLSSRVGARHKATLSHANNNNKSALYTSTLSAVAKAETSASPVSAAAAAAAMIPPGSGFGVRVKTEEIETGAAGEHVASLSPPPPLTPQAAEAAQLNHRRRCCCSSAPLSRFSSSTDTVAAEVPMRFYLPTIPALLPLGVTARELSTRLPKSSAVDASALQHLLLCQERFLIPELLFTPGDVGLDQQGVSQAVSEGIFQRGLLQHVSTLLRPQLLRRVCVYGGVAQTPFLLERLRRELQAASPSSLEEANSILNPDPSASEVDSVRAAARDRMDEAACGVPDIVCASGGVEPLPFIPEVLKSAVTAALPAQTSFDDVALSLMPLVGAYRLFTAHSDSSGETSRSPPQHTPVPPSQMPLSLEQLHYLVQQRSSIALQHPVNGKVTVETFQDALRQLL